MSQLKRDRLIRILSDGEVACGAPATLKGTFRNAAEGWVSGTYYSMAVTPGGTSKTADTKYTMVSKEDVDNSQRSGDEFALLQMPGTAGARRDLSLAVTTQVPGFAGVS